MNRLGLLFLFATSIFAQQVGLEEYLRYLKIAPGTSVAEKMKALNSMGVTLSENGMRELTHSTRQSFASPEYQPSVPTYSSPSQVTGPAGTPHLRSADPQRKYLGDLNSNQYDPNSVSNPYGKYGSPYSPDSINNPYGAYGSPYSPYSATNPYTTQAPAVIAPNGRGLGRLSANPYDPNSTSNPYGQYGSPYSPNSINNPYGTYGSPYSPNSVRNPYSTGQQTPLPTKPNRLTFPRY